MSKWFLEHTKADHGHAREVEPRIVIEVAFDAVTCSDRHNSGFALRFPRIVRLRNDKPAEDTDTLERVEEIYNGGPKRKRQPSPANRLPSSLPPLVGLGG